MNKRSFLYPPQEYIDTLPIRTQQQLPIIVRGNFIYLFIFSILTASIFITQKYFIATLCLCMMLTFFISIVLIPNKKVQLASYFTSMSLLIAVAIVQFFATKEYQTQMVIYRNAYFMATMAIGNSIMSLRKRQLKIFATAEMIMFLLGIPTVFKHIFVISKLDTIIALVVAGIPLIVINLIILILNKFNGNLVKHATKREAEFTEAYTKVRNAIEESQESLNIGKRLNEAAGSAAESVSEIGNLYTYLMQASSNLNQEASSAKESGTTVTEQAQQMRNSVQEQNKSISETSTAMTQMSANLSNINAIATQRRSGIETLVKGLDDQLKLLKVLVEQVSKVQESSHSIETFVSTVETIASQTGLLAMNASIEAAHAGTLGKGFSVIAHEIRKLSEETTKNANQISETLKENAELVQATTSSVDTFAKYTERTTAEMRTTIQAIEEILAGISEIDAGTRDVMNSLQIIVSESQVNSNLVEGVTQKIGEQGVSLNNISDFADTLQERVSNLDNLVTNIKVAIGNITKDAADSTEVSQKINASLA